MWILNCLDSPLARKTYRASLGCQTLWTASAASVGWKNNFLLETSCIPNCYTPDCFLELWTWQQPRTLLSSAILWPIFLALLAFCSTFWFISLFSPQAGNSREKWQKEWFVFLYPTYAKNTAEVVKMNESNVIWYWPISLCVHSAGKNNVRAGRLLL